MTSFTPDIQTKTYEHQGDQVSAFVPFCCQEQTGELYRVGFVFLCTVEDGEPVAAPAENRDIHWVTKTELRRILTETPERIFVFQWAALDYYLNY